MSHDYDPGPLQALGFTETEALVYGYLVENSPATGYRISHAIGKQPANTYKALRSLEDKGAIIIESGKSNLCQAVPPEEFSTTWRGGSSGIASRPSVNWRPSPRLPRMAASSI